LEIAGLAGGSSYDAARAIVLPQAAARCGIFWMRWRPADVLARLFSTAQPC